MSFKCKEANSTTWPALGRKLAQWDAIYLADAQARLQGMMVGYDMSIRDVENLVSVAQALSLVLIFLKSDGDVRLRGLSIESV